ncbi:SGNH/GDSL hydrolase family protein [Oscillatoria salina]|uniref:hypothetical protein n=1 Tax=Oscillatoria salina TaxID=331517 RepID=UPI0013B60DB3|nr:hypothetical protein [Oscillatoria salina]MBZ8182204.1 hypothetical protein [Oscillatoria salina IIICB1]NET89069.1 hypothetical protein [Kamptonema sp. SIO1D9]
MKSYRRYIIILLLVIILNLSLISLFNIFIDPYDVMSSPKILGINQVKLEKEKQVRLFKARAITTIKTPMIFLGSSRTEFGLDPNHPALKADRPVYNLAITGANMYEVMRYFQHAIAVQPELKKIVLGIDFFMFNAWKTNAPDFQENRLQKTKIINQDLLNVTLSLDALTASLATLESNQKNPHAVGYFYPNGMRNTNYYIKKIYKSKSTQKIFQVTLQDFLSRPENFQKEQLSAKSLKNLKRIVDTCKQKQISLYIFISPSHVTRWEAIKVAETWSEWEEWKRQVVEITPVWDFSGYNSITTEPINEEMKYYFDNSHYTKEAGDLILNKLFDYQKEKVPTDFGVFLSANNLEEHLHKIRIDRQKWAQAHPLTVQFVQNLKPN